VEPAPRRQRASHFPAADPRAADLRAADSDRQSVADRLSQAFREGRLRDDEYAERLDAAFRASTYRELSLLTADLPSTDRARARRRRSVRRERLRARRRMPAGLTVLWTLWGIGVSVNTMVYVLVALTSHGSVYPWPIWVAGPAGAALGTITLATRPHWRERSPEADVPALPPL
jgi:Domain of unknown function (DUF1707)